MCSKIDYCTHDGILFLVIAKPAVAGCGNLVPIVVMLEARRRSAFGGKHLEGGLSLSKREMQEGFSSLSFPESGNPETSLPRRGEIE